MPDRLNPYAPPPQDTSTVSGPMSHNGRAVVATCIRKSWFGREIQLSGGIDAIVRYNAAGGGEKVFVNDVLAAKSSAMYLTVVVAPSIDFEINAGDTSVPATVDVYAAWLQFFRVIRFSLTVGGHVVYTDP